MASLEELKSALQETLESRGSLDKLRAQLRAEIFHTLDDQTEPRPEISDENLILNELIREYLVHNKLHHTVSVFLAESGQPSEPFGRAFLASEIGVSDDPNSRGKPLLNSLLRQAKEAKAAKTARITAGIASTGPTSRQPGQPGPSSTYQPAQTSGAPYGQPQSQTFTFGATNGGPGATGSHFTQSRQPMLSETNTVRPPPAPAADDYDDSFASYQPYIQISNFK
eukprot:TRINITY_DN2554_c0_g1_i2.p1 TRINITY_DN2554_c0_g1~~TRINITY_DN2554_c0_g1_i2.p1  ORF type:complete len:225 (-),score=79.62 TRINITY_DN2554_c0_g1_i2:406-1080(-)